MDIESLKRVLTELKGEARKMRKDELGSRLAPAAKEEETAAPEELPAALEEGEATQLADAGEEESEAELADTGEPGDESGGGEDADLKRVLKKYGI